MTEEKIIDYDSMSNGPHYNYSVRLPPTQHLSFLVDLTVSSPILLDEEKPFWNLLNITLQ